MKTPMGPPPPRNPNPNPNSQPSSSDQTPQEDVEPTSNGGAPADENAAAPVTEPENATPMGPPPPQNLNPNPNPNSEPSSSDQTPQEDVEPTASDGAPADENAAAPVTEPEKVAPGETGPRDDFIAGSTPSGPQEMGAVVPYSIPSWSQPPGYPFYFEVLKDGSIIEQLDVSEKGAYMFGRVDLCDFVLEHPTISRFHAVLQFKKDSEALLYDLGSTHGTVVNKTRVKKKVYTKLHVGDVIRFGQSSRLYIFEGPTEFMPPEGDLKKLRNAKIHEEMIDREASLLRAKVEASLTEGISWGIGEDAVEEDTENAADEVTWQTYKGQLTERQEKTRGKVLKRLEKVANMKKEIDAIRAKDIAQGGLTQGQQTQIARNEQRIAQIMEELDSLEETLNESIQESIGARTGKVAHGRKQGNVEDEDNMLSDDDDDFYDRTKKRSSTKKSGEQQSVETAETLLDKKQAIMNKMEEKKELLRKEKDKVPIIQSNAEGEDDLDAYMTGISSQLVLDEAQEIEKEISSLQSELDRTLYLLKIADPSGEAARKRDLKAEASKSSEPIAIISKRPKQEQKKIIVPVKPKLTSEKDAPLPSAEAEKHGKEGEDVPADKAAKPPAYTAQKPQWLGAKRETQVEENAVQEVNSESNEADKFVDYKDRKTVLGTADNGKEIELAAPGLIIRKRKPAEKPDVTVNKAPKVVEPSSGDAEVSAADAVALLLKHKRGYSTLDEEGQVDDEQSVDDPSPKETSKPKRVFGPSRPKFLEKSPDYESWVPPEGQTGDGRTTLNDRLGY